MDTLGAALAPDQDQRYSLAWPGLELSASGRTNPECDAVQVSHYKSNKLMHLEGLNFKCSTNQKYHELKMHRNFTSKIY